MYFLHGFPQTLQLGGDVFCPPVQYFSWKCFLLIIIFNYYLLSVIMIYYYIWYHCHLPQFHVLLICFTFFNFCEEKRFYSFSKLLLQKLVPWFSCISDSFDEGEEDLEETLKKKLSYSIWIFLKSSWTLTLCKQPVAWGTIFFHNFFIIFFYNFFITFFIIFCYLLRSRGQNVVAHILQAKWTPHM